MSYVTIGTELKNLLDSIPELNAVFNYNEKKSDKYPYAIILTNGHRDRFNDTAANVREFNFNIFALNTTTSDADGERIMRIIADKIIDKIESNVTLNGSCDFAIPTEGTWGYVSDSNPPYRYIQISVVAKVRKMR